MKSKSKSKKKKKTASNKPIYLNAGAILAIVVLGIVLITVAANNQANPNTTGSNQNHSASSASKKPGSTGQSATGKSSSSSTSPVSSIPATTGPCASIFTLEEARTLMGNSASAAAGNGISSQTSDITTITCVYNIGTDTATVTENAYTDSNGSNANQIEFGSGRPSGAQHVDGFGQSAFWYNNQLNILLNNNWYVVTYNKQGSVTLSNSEDAASAAKLQASY